MIYIDDIATKTSKAGQLAGSSARRRETMSWSPGTKSRVSSFLTRHDRIALYVPNLIGYARIACALMAFAVSSTSVTMTLVLYFVSFACDELDGRMARLLGQQSTMGAVLDMVTDRVATCGLVTVLYGRIMDSGNRIVRSRVAQLSDNMARMVGLDLGVRGVTVVLTVVLIGLVFLDVVSHWFHMYASLATQGLGSSHKSTNIDDPWLIQMYYKNRIFMGFCCVCVEVEYLVLYAMTFEEMMVGWRGILLYGIAIMSVPGFLLKQIANIVQLRRATAKLVALDVEKRTARDEGLSKMRARQRTPSRSRQRSTSRQRHSARRGMS